MEQLKEALANNFGYSCTAGAPAAAPADDEAKIYEAVKRILSNNGSINIAELQAQLSTGTCGWESGRPNYTAGNPAPSNEQFAKIKRIMENTPWFGNDDDEVDMLARKCGQIYSYEVEKYKNPRGGQFQAGCYPVSANVLFGKDVGALPDGRLAKTAFPRDRVKIPMVLLQQLCPLQSLTMRTTPTVLFTIRSSFRPHWQAMRA